MLRTLDHLRVLVPDRRRAAYVCSPSLWNLGDAAMLQAHAELFPELNFRPIPGGGRNRLLRAAKILARGRLGRAVFIGGGTLIGRRAYRKRTDAVRQVAPELPLFMLGTGVEDPDFHSPPRTHAAELEQWRTTLASCDNVAVRGPRSQEILAPVGIPCEVAGDPALFYADDQAASSFTERLMGVNIGATREIWGGDPGRVLEVVVAALRRYQSKGWRIRFFIVSHEHRGYTWDAAKRLDLERVEVLQCTRTREFLNAARECHIFVGEKLHSVVLASCVYVPSLMLEYRPKCMDFQRSIGREQWVLRTSQLTPTLVVDACEALAQSRDEHADGIRRGVQEARRRLLVQVQKIRHKLIEAEG